MGARILIIEDNATNLELMTYLLTAFGHTPLIAEDGQVGLEVVRRQMPDLVLCDVQLPILDGYEVARQLKEDPELMEIPLVAVTALAMVGDRDRVLAAGFDGYIPKPIVPEAFVAQAEAFLDSGHRLSTRCPFSAPAPATIAPPACPTPLRARILCVDYSPVDRELIRSTLKPVGYQVAFAESRRDALLLAGRSLPHLILSDLKMPRETGLDLLRAVKANRRLRTVPFIFITSSEWGQRERGEALALGAACFLLRPIEPETLLHEIEDCLVDRAERIGARR